MADRMEGVSIVRIHKQVSINGYHFLKWKTAKKASILQYWHGIICSYLRYKVLWYDQSLFVFECSNVVITITFSCNILFIVSVLQPLNFYIYIYTTFTCTYFFMTNLIIIHIATILGFWWQRFSDWLRGISYNLMNTCSKKNMCIQTDPTQTTQA